MRLAVLGAGPIGLEVATHAAREGLDVTVYEAGKVGAGVLSWGHVRLFTPWRMNTTELGRSVVGGGERLASDEHPTGAEYVREYLHPLARWLDVRTGHRVRGVAKARLLKGEAIGSTKRLREPFRLLIDGPMGETTAMADAIVDCTGVLTDPTPAGPGGLPATGEEALARSGHLLYGPIHVAGSERRRILLVGDGASACTVLRDLVSTGARTTWLTHAPDGPGFVSPADDPLPLRRALWDEAARAVADPMVAHKPGVGIEKLLSREDGAVEARLDDGSEIVVDRVVVCTGNRPDLRLARELQVHLCYASEGTMKLAAALLDQGDGDCLAQTAAGAELLRSPEPGYFVLGSKSYGRRSDFLLQAGHRQVQEVIGLVGALRADRR